MYNRPINRESHFRVIPRMRPSVYYRKGPWGLRTAVPGAGNRTGSFLHHKSYWAAPHLPEETESRSREVSMGQTTFGLAQKEGLGQHAPVFPPGEGGCGGSSTDGRSVSWDPGLCLRPRPWTWCPLSWAWHVRDISSLWRHWGLADVLQGHSSTLLALSSLDALPSDPLGSLKTDEGRVIFTCCHSRRPGPQMMCTAMGRERVPRKLHNPSALPRKQRSGPRWGPWTQSQGWSLRCQKAEFTVYRQRTKTWGGRQGSVAKCRDPPTVPGSLGLGSLSPGA